MCAFVIPQALNWLIRSVTSPVCLHDLMWFFVAAQAPPDEEEEEEEEQKDKNEKNAENKEVKKEVKKDAEV